MKEIIGIYLAAGKSRRMGKCKLSLPLAVKPLGTIALKEIMQSNIDHLLVVTNDIRADWLNSADVLRAYLNKWENIVCLQAHLGQSYSLRTGIRRAEQLGAKSVIVFLADQPFVTSKMINLVINEARNDHVYVASSDGKVLKPPILFNEKAFDELMIINGDQGARSLLRKGTFSGTSIQMSPDYLFDIDTVEEYEYAKTYYLGNINHFLSL
ncbi:nucleotidyltransferase family protein [Metabacillus rhizolycopersici]|jgi:molybdenum cofactor cytidylyltransferase|uniref:Nucleotidyltransferase family protein n=1 Tax=Metabacillus rhizolycopersici TaxID=2875709 RepID=A0ABS7UTK4_9BACI|nr:nucleotidyltransferase family protein [Metabacillus rhizolycopersici]MBZ5751621.1 nucleotidyltransferase family protein [Metabacillus rhizolycopersici]